MADPPVALPSSRSERVPPDRAGSRLDVFVAGWLGVSRAEVRRLLTRGALRLEGRTLGLADKGLPLPAQGCVEVLNFLPPADRRPPAPQAGAEPPVLAEGPGWIAIDKPAGMPVHPLREDEQGSALGYVAAHHPEIHGVGEGGLRSGVVHRLDVDTSGVLLMATEQASWERLRRAFTEQRIEKIYTALVTGSFEGERDLRLCVRVAQHRPARVRVAAGAGRGEAAGASDVREIAMRVRALEALGAATLVEVRPRTGFLHQIRVALAHIGHPLLGDRVYGDELAAAASRHMLHASSLRFEEIAAACDPPADFQARVRMTKD